MSWQLVEPRIAKNDGGDCVLYLGPWHGVLWCRGGLIAACPLEHVVEPTRFIIPKGTLKWLRSSGATPAPEGEVIAHMIEGLSTMAHRAAME